MARTLNAELELLQHTCGGEVVPAFSNAFISQMSTSVWHDNGHQQILAILHVAGR